MTFQHFRYLCCLKFFFVQRPQWITLGLGLLLTAALFLFGRTVPHSKEKKPAPAEAGTVDEHGHETGGVTIDTILVLAKKRLSPEVVVRLNTLENSISRGNVREQQLQVYRQLALFWSDTARIFEPYAWYTAEAARLENSEKSLTFAGQLFLDNLQVDDVARRKQWKALQAKDLFERSLQLNPDNDSAKVGLGACYLFGGISENPMEGIMKIREVAEKDSTNVYAQLTLAKGALLTGQYDKAIVRVEHVISKQPSNLEAMLLLADLYERTGEKKKAAAWYRRCLPQVNSNYQEAIRQRIAELEK